MVQLGMSFDIPVKGNSILEVHADFQTAVASMDYYARYVLAKLAYCTYRCNKGTLTHPQLGTLGLPKRHSVDFLNGSQSCCLLLVVVDV